jgi:hypothetical protein
MKSLRAKLARLAAAVVASLIVATSAYALPLPVTVLDYSGFLPMQLTDTGIFQTVDGAAVESLLNWSGFIPLADGAGKVRITGVTLTGTASNPVPGLYAQSTTGGMIEVFDLSDVLQLSVAFTDGLLQVATSGVGSQFTTGTASFGGALAAYLAPTSAAHSLSLVNFSSAGIGENLSLLPGTGVGNGVIAGSEVPEPMTLLLLGSGLIGGIAARRKAA